MRLGTDWVEPKAGRASAKFLGIELCGGALFEMVYD